MPELPLPGGAALYYRDDDLTDPWKASEPVFMLHGNYENGLAYNGWMPRFARRFRVLRPDMRGFGRSTPMPVDYPWSIDGIVDDYLAVADALGIDRFHVIGAKFGAVMAMHLAATRPERVRTLTAIGPQIRGADSPSGREKTIDHFVRLGIKSWADETMVERLGSECPPALLKGWGEFMGTSPLSTQIGFARGIPAIDITDELPKIVCPALAITTERTIKGSVAETRKWQELIPNAELAVLPGNSYHVAIVDPDAAAKASIAFIDHVAVRA